MLLFVLLCLAVLALLLSIDLLTQGERLTKQPYPPLRSAPHAPTPH